MITELYFETSVPKGSKGIPISWDISMAELKTASKEDGTLALFGCGCSTFTQVDLRIVGTYNLELHAPEEKVFFLFLDDGNPLYVANEQGVKIRNDGGKRHIKLRFKLNVQS